MNRRRHGKRRWIRWTRRIVAGLAALLLLGFLGLQLLLTTPWMRGKVAGKLSQRMGGLEVVIASLSWTPWNGAKIGGLEVKQPEVLRAAVPTSLLVVDEIHAWPDYGAALKGRLSMNEVKLIRPKLHVTVDMLVSIAAASMPAAEPPAIAAVVPQAGPVAAPRSDVPPTGAAQSPREEANSVQQPAVVEVPETEAGATPQAAPELTRKRMHLVVEEGGFELVRVGMEERLAGVEAVNLDLPLFGEAGEAYSSVGMIECLGQSIADDLKIQVETKGNGVKFSLPGDTKEAFGLFGSCSVGLIRGLPFQADLMLRLPKVEKIQVSEMLSGQSDELQGRVQGGGWLQAPGSWRGVSAFEAKKPMGWLGGFGGIGGQVVGFDSASAVVQLAGGVIQSPDFRMIGDSASLLGNGWVTSSDGAAVVRLVVPYAAVGMLNTQFGKRVPDGIFAFRPLKPDNRWYSDVSLWRDEAGWCVGFGDGGTVAPLDEMSLWGN